jgi:ribose 5-phosphate isomerase B
MMKIAIASDHAGFEYKEAIRAHLAALGHEVKDFGAFNNERSDYPVFVRPAAEAVASGEFDRGIVLGGSGNGEAIAANRVKGIRCTIAWDVRSARYGRSHNNSNVLSLGQRMMAVEEALELVDIWLETEFEGGRHADRIAMLDE